MRNITQSRFTFKKLIEIQTFYDNTEENQARASIIGVGLEMSNDITKSI